MSGPGKGVAYWKDIKLTSFNPTLMDVALLVVHDLDKTDISQLVETKPLTGKYPRLNSDKWHDVVSYQRVEVNCRVLRGENIIMQGM